ncbi:MAG: SH3 domain-containing protein [Candidatus Riflebacteria bacterium]|nr:SH3 domain-containing protein [Candidatus Riflebacteria bacterium]
MKRLLLLAAAVLLFIAPSPAPGGTTPPASRVTVGAGVRLRAAPQTTGAEVCLLPLGTVLEVRERGAAPATVGTKTDFWYQVKAPDGRSGWVFGALTRPFSPDQARTFWRELFAERLAKEDASLDDHRELFQLVERLQKQFPVPAATAGGRPASDEDRAFAFELALVRLQALHAMLAAIPHDRREKIVKTDPLLKSLADLIVYSEPAGCHFVRADEFWNLADRAAPLPVAETIAWAAARQPLPGETEGYIPAVLAVIRLTDGRYLDRFPKGPHAEDAVKRIDEYLGNFDEFEFTRDNLPLEDVASAAEELDALEKTLEPTGSPLLVSVFQRLARLRALCRPDPAAGKN